MKGIQRRDRSDGPPKVHSSILSPRVQYSGVGALSALYRFHSRRQDTRFVKRQDFATTIRRPVRAVGHLGGVAATCLHDNCLYDNMKVAVTECDGEKPVYSVETSLLNGRTFRSLDHPNEVAARWLAGTDRRLLDGRIHRETRHTPLARHSW